MGVVSVYFIAITDGVVVVMVIMLMECLIRLKAQQRDMNSQ